MKNKPVTVIGGGRSGLAAAALLRRLGARVFLSEEKALAGKALPGVEFEEGGHTDRALEAELIIRSPGISNRHPLVQAAARRRIPVWSELELAFNHVYPQQLVAITGTNGKTTTTTLVGEFFKATGRPALVGGNIGIPLSEMVEKVGPATTLVLEVSSYQLENIEKFRPTISAILNLTPDHLEHHGSMRAYAAAKARIFENQRPEDVCVLNADDAWCRRLANKCAARVFWFSRREPLPRGIYYHQGQLVLRWPGADRQWKLETLLPGHHNVENILAAVAIAVTGGVPIGTIRQVLASFRGVEHRLELVRTVNDVRYVNDSKGTNVDSTRVALSSFDEPLIVIMGGQGKGSPYKPLAPLIKKRVKRLLLIGEEAARIAREVGSAAPHEIVGALPRAVQRAHAAARPGDVVLLSPACASFDQYKNYEERGRHFKRLVKTLK